MPVWSGGLASHPLKILFFARWETIESLCLSFLYTSRQMCFQHKPGRRPPQITGRRVSAGHQGGVGAPNKLATFRVHDAVVISSKEVCGEHEIAPRLIQVLLENFSG